jgi:hypothetical protein
MSKTPRRRRIRLEVMESKDWITDESPVVVKIPMKTMMMAALHLPQNDGHTDRITLI